MLEALAIVLALALVASNVAWLRYLSRRDGSDRDERAELWTRIQHPTLVTPRAAVEYDATPPPNGNEPDPRDYAGTVTSTQIPIGDDDEEPDE